ncbi:MAG: twin-arginine translocase TatA/TatE family subunit [Proteobacteria bacterium]|nr:twin-arginine translocase TatA/TatE family subunit [Pseudomonadota bacterium]
MGILGIRPLSLLLILAIVIVIFGGKRLKNIGQDLAAAIKGFREGIKEEQTTKEEKE